MTKSPPSGIAFALTFSACILCSTASAQSNERWFQVEVAIFTNEDPTDRELEFWQPPTAPLRYPASVQRLQDLMDLLVIDELLLDGSRDDTGTELPSANTSPVQTITDYINATGPFPANTQLNFRLFDFARDAFVQLPLSASNFQQTNRAIERAADHRLLFHGLWRQPVRGTAESTPLLIRGGSRYGDDHELQGTLTIRFNANADRVVIDADLWLSEFTIVAEASANWELPDVPVRLRRDFEQNRDPVELDYHIRRIYQLKQSRDMRSTEFHYLDHPALGLIIMVEPYQVPARSLNTLEPDAAPLQ